jgi:NAD(P)-dependent dehydrogenase (short-subunit alcohol dehydrogenase family)
VVLVTGAGSGIGRAIAGAFAAQGDAVVAVDIDGDAAAATMEPIVAQGGSGLVVPADIASPTDVDRTIAATLDAYGRIDVLCNNAGIMDSSAVDETSLEWWDRVLAVNLTGPFLLCRGALAPMLAQASGVIINVSSLAGLVGGRAGAAYTASKHALVGLTRNIAWTYLEKGIRANAICPGAISTNTMATDTGSSHTGLGYERFSRAVATNPRVGEPSDVAGLATFLASDAAGFITGEAIAVDGGWLAM